MIRIAALAIVLACTLSTEAAHAQARDPRYPVCLQVFGPTSYYNCRFTSIAQCKVEASGRAAQCDVNPFFAGAPLDRPAQHRRRQPN